MEVLEIRGKRLVKASVAARKAGYTSDYVGQLCRSGAVDAELVGRSWYVDAEQLAAHRVEKKRNSRVKAREQVKKALQEREKELPDSLVEQVPPYLRHFMNAKDVAYGADERELIPLVRKSEAGRFSQQSTQQEDRSDEPYNELSEDPGEPEAYENDAQTRFVEEAHTVIEIRRPEPVVKQRYPAAFMEKNERQMLEMRYPKGRRKGRPLSQKKHVEGTGRPVQVAQRAFFILMIGGIALVALFGQSVMHLEKQDDAINVTTRYTLNLEELEASFVWLQTKTGF